MGVFTLGFSNPSFLSLVNRWVHAGKDKLTYNLPELRVALSTSTAPAVSAILFGMPASFGDALEFVHVRVSGRVWG
jgi:hypothetical protein